MTDCVSEGRLGSCARRAGVVNRSTRFALQVYEVATVQFITIETRTICNAVIRFEYGSVTGSYCKSVIEV